MRKISVSVVIPAYNEAGSLQQLYQELTAVLDRIGKSYEIIFVNDGSKDGSQTILENLFLHDKRHVRAIQFRNNFGKAAALRAGFQFSHGKYIIQLDADLQDDPKEIPKFIDQLDHGFDMVVGWKQQRQDSLIKNQSSKLFNWATNKISKVKLHDHNCGFKAYTAEVAKGFNLYGELHRYLGVIASAQGHNVAEVKIAHRRRIYGKTKYNSLRFVHGFLDLLTVIFLTRFRSRPLHLFGYLGTTFFTVGFLIGLYLTGVKFILHQSIGDRPLLLFSVMLMIMGVQISVTGLVGEQINSAIRKNSEEYSIKKIIGEK